MRFCQLLLAVIVFHSSASKNKDRHRYSKINVGRLLNKESYHGDVENLLSYEKDAILRRRPDLYSGRFFKHSPSSSDKTNSIPNIYVINFSDYDQSSTGGTGSSFPGSVTTSGGSFTPPIGGAGSGIIGTDTDNNGVIDVIDDIDDTDDTDDTDDIDDTDDTDDIDDTDDTDDTDDADEDIRVKPVRYFIREEDVYDDGVIFGRKLKSVGDKFFVKYKI